MNKENNIYFDLRAYENGNGGDIRDDLTTVLIENGESSLEERITPYEINFDKEGNPNFELRWETENDFYENEALFKARDLMRNGSEYLLWISPSGEKEDYSESRMVVFLNKGEDEQGNLISECRGICAKFDLNECLDIARSLESGIETETELRSNPIEFYLGESNDWIERLEEVIDMSEVWEAIRKGADVIKMKEKRDMVDEVLGEIELRGEKRMSYEEAIWVGVQIEEAIEMRGVSLQASGSCGISNSEALRLQSSFNVVFQNSLIPGLKPEGYNYYCSVCKCWCKDSTCPLCKLKLKY